MRRPQVERVGQDLQTGINEAEWPLVGRSEELELLRRLRSSSPPVSSLIAGAAGVGKSSLARAARDEAGREGWATLAIRGTAGFAAVPYGPFRTILALPRSTGLSELTDSVASALLSMRTGKGLLILADDYEQLDELSASLLQQMAAADQIMAVMTARSGPSSGTSLIDLWKDGLATRLELQNLSPRETSELVAAALGAPVHDSSARRIWRVTEGNPLYVREVVRSSIDSGSLRMVDGEWRWRDEGAHPQWASGVRLREVVTARLGRLDPQELSAMEILAVAGQLPLKIATSLTSHQAIESLEALGLVTAERNGRRTELSISHPLHAEVLLHAMPELQQRSVRRHLVDAVNAEGARRTADRVQLACWSIESGLDADVITLSLGADASLFGSGRAISSRLDEIFQSPGVERTERDLAVREDLDLAIRMAEAAYLRTGAIVEAVALSSTLAWAGAVGRAEAVLSDLAGQAQAVDDQLRLALALSFVRFWGRYQLEEARSGLLEAADSAGGDGDVTLLATVYEQLAGMELQTGQPAAALAYAEQSARIERAEIQESAAALPAAAALAHLGRCTEALSLIERALPAARNSGHPLAVATLLFSRVGALLRSGQFEAAHELGVWLRDVAVSGGFLGATANFGVLLGEVQLRQGRSGSAGRLFLDAAGLLAENDIFGYRPWALAGLARTRALAGELDSAEAALDEARRIRPIHRHFDLTLYLAEVDLHTLAGRPGAAIDAAKEAADWTRESGLVVDEAQALDVLVRMEPSSATASRISELASAADSDLVHVLAGHAQAFVASDPDALLAAAQRFAAMPAWWMAAEAALAASRILERRNRSRASHAAARASRAYREHCNGIRHLPEGVGGPAPLTKREREIAVLAAAGKTNKEIAEGMYVSTRTVENHLYRVYVKLGVTDRAGLAAALGRPGFQD